MFENTIAAFLPAAGLKPIAAQQAFMASRHRFNIAPAGRRSGKTMTGKLRAFKRAFTIPHADGRVVYSAPTHKQTRRIFWRDVKRLYKPFTVGKPKEGDMQLTLVNGVTIECAGLDAPERIEGAPLDHIHFDEYADMKPEVWTEHVRPMLAERDGTADFTGTPEGRDHFHQLWMDAQDDDEWGAYTWTAEAVLPPSEIERLKRDLDELTYDQEIRASFVNFAGRAYYAFDSVKHVRTDLPYDPAMPLIVCLDFNVEPGVAAFIQEHADFGTCIIDEIHIERDSNTPRVCRAIIEKYGAKHTGDVLLYGDATGGLRGSAKIEGSDWDLVRQNLKPVFKDRLKWRVPRANPPVRSCVNAVNSRATSGKLLANKKCKWTILDFEGVQRDESGDILKEKGDKLTHLSDAIRYYVQEQFPVVGVVGGMTTY